MVGSIIKMEYRVFSHTSKRPCHSIGPYYVLESKFSKTERPCHSIGPYYVLEIKFSKTERPCHSIGPYYVLESKFSKTEDKYHHYHHHHVTCGVLGLMTGSGLSNSWKVCWGHPWLRFPSIWSANIPERTDVRAVGSVMWKDRSVGWVYRFLYCRMGDSVCWSWEVCLVHRLCYPSVL
jgi:hypothetical protein